MLSGRFGDLKVDRGNAPRSCTPTSGLRHQGLLLGNEVPKGAEETRYQEQDSQKG